MYRSLHPRPLLRQLTPRLPFRLSFHRTAATSGEASPPLVLQIWGSNTGVGKTVLSAALLRTAERPSLFLKPVQSGYPEDDDGAVVQTHATHARAATLLTLRAPVGPDLAVTLDGVEPMSDAELRSRTAGSLQDFAGYSDAFAEPGRRLALVETAGGVLSPAPSGALQADVYRPLRLPAVLLGDSSLGGVSGTLAAYEALFSRGYDVPVVVLFGDPGGVLENEVSIQRAVRPGTAVFRAPALPPKEVPLESYFGQAEVDEFFLKLYMHLRHIEDERYKTLGEMREEAKDIFWYPFTQHTNLKNVTCIDSASGDNFTCFDDTHGLHTMMDAVGSWWTNGVGHGNSSMSTAMAHAAGRYGHVMFAEAVYAPAHELAKRMLGGVGAGWASRVFFTDDGSTAVEVALKMAFRKRAVDAPERRALPVRIVGVEGCYHGDTLGVMDCAPRSDYNSQQTPWYEPRGVFFEPPTACIANGVWTVRMPAWTGAEDVVFREREEVFDSTRTHEAYDRVIAERLDEVLDAQEADLGALVLEPVVLGAGGMQLVDPAFQRALVDACRARRIPVVFDEVFTGVWRLGAESGAKLLERQPDVATYAKLVTGGTVPLALTLASEAVFGAFRGDTKREALLHGHSYTGHAIGCAAGVEALRLYERADGVRGEHWDEMAARELSCTAGVKSVTCIGTVLAVEVVADGEGYAATGAVETVRRLKERGIFARPLGNVVYLMCSPLSGREECKKMMAVLLQVLDGNGSRESKVDEERAM